MTIPLLEQPVQHLLSLLERDAPRCIVGMVGVPGSGKSTLAAGLVEEVNARTAPSTLVAVGLDGFHLSRAELKLLPNPVEALARRGAPWTFDPAAFLSRLRLLREAAGHAPVTWPDFQHEVGDPVHDAHLIAPTTRLILVEGLYLLHDADGWEAARPFFDEIWCLNTPFPVAMERLTGRHQTAWGMTRAEAEQRVNANDRINSEIVLRSFPHADWRLIP